MEQVKFSFDRETVIKIAKGALIALTGAAALGLLDYIGTIEVDNELVAMIIAWIVPTLTNAVKEWARGE